ncbi:YhcN/YlaJ family sporulation lipoprotein [Priestia megaterium]|nr:YhcN/YlaJ family sporulation lipoprotein [Priestia megaterium]
MKERKYLFGLLSTVLSAGFLFGCNATQDEAEPDPTEEPSEQRQDNARLNDGPQNVGFDPDNGNIQDDNNNVDQDNGNQTRLEVADEAADRVVKLDEVDRANVIVTNRNAYVAVVLHDGAKGEVTDRIEKKVADQVRAADPDIQEVFVSSNPDFVDRMTDYGERINQGDPIEGFFEEFTETVRRAFPNPR